MAAVAAVPRRRRIGRRRRVEDEGEDDGRTEPLDVDDESLTDGSLLTDDDDAAEDSDTSNIDEASPTSPGARKSANGAPKRARPHPRPSAAAADTDMMLHGLSMTDRSGPAQDMHFDDVVVSPPKSPSAPVVVSSASARRQPPPPPPPPPGISQGDRRRQEHDDYKRRRDVDPAFVPNRGSFFMHDHRHAGPASNGFRPFGRGRGRGGGRGGIGGIGGPFSPFNHHVSNPSDPTTSSPWTHDMHDMVADPTPRHPRHMPHSEGPPNGNGFIPTCEPSPTPINRTLSTEKHIGNAQVRVFFPHLMKGPTVFPGLPIKQYTKLPDHRPPLRRDKPVRISLPDHPPRYVFPAPDRSFTFIPRALRPNQQRMRGKPRSAWGSVGGFSRRTSILGGGSYYGSVYSPSIALSRRSSVAAHDRDMVFSPTGSAISRPAMPVDAARPVVRLPPSSRPPVMAMSEVVMEPAHLLETPMAAHEASISDLPQPQMHPLPQKPVVQENRPGSLPMHQPRPQKNISVADIESPTLTQGPQAFHQPFHQQVPLQVANGLSEAETHARGPVSYPSQHSTGTPLSQIPERAIHAAPFQPNSFGQQPYYGQQQAYPPPQPPPPQPPPPQQGFYYPQGFSGPVPAMAPSAAAPPFVPSGQHGFASPGQTEQPATQASFPHTPGVTSAASSNLVAQEVNGMVYYYDTSQIQPVGPVGPYAPYPAHQGFQPGVLGMGGVVTPSPDGFFYPQPAPGVVYYSH
ncbi:hypothetical protein XA68_12737 [Ophiocordyceps unilateralis]|uniref:Btz domain-containing protein n=1 Tax=Ophiocordyceps unilateralis TaxID=268505 RepID=A0A2A9PEC6_OPHUN|nr:hypothetical protein XA68_12737 [Ophiocordyceps unilateralis]